MEIQENFISTKILIKVVSAKSLQNRKLDQMKHDRKTLRTFAYMSALGNSTSLKHHEA